MPSPTGFLRKERDMPVHHHAEQLKKLRRKIMAFNDQLVVELLLMSLDGKVEKIA
jgi:hypothetical protein